MAAENENSFSASWAERSELPLERPSIHARFFIIKVKDGSFDKVSPFLIHKSLTAVIGDAKSVKKLRSGELLVEVTNNVQSLEIAKAKSLGNIPIEVSAHKTLNVSKGVISESDLICASENEILQNLKDQMVSGVSHKTSHPHFQYTQITFFYNCWILALPC
jgi:hypothetical protein